MISFPPVAETRHEIHERLPNTLIDTATASYSSPSSQILTSCDLWIKEIREAVSLHGPLNESWFKKEGNEEKEAPIALDNTPATASTTTPNTATASTQKRGLPNPSVRIPILVLQRALTSTRSLQHSKSGGYSILLPRSWGSTFIHSFVYAGCRVAGMDELQALEFEDLMGRGGSSSSSGPLLNLPSFPFHWLGTTAGNTWLNTKDEGRLLEMNKKPPAKRGVALKTEWSMEKSTVRLLSDLSKQVTGGLDVMDVDGDSTGTSFYVVQSPVLVSLISSIILKGGNRNKWTDMVEEEPEKIEYKQTTSSRSSFISFNAQLESVLLSTPSSFHQKQPLKIFESLATAFVMVKITLPQSGGAITDKCIIYAVKSLAHLNEFCPKKPSRNESQLLKGLVYTAEGGLGVGSSSSRLLDDDDDDDALVDDQLLLDKFPDKEYILGYSTRGNFVLSKGKSCAIGVVSIKRLVEFYGEQNDAVISSNHQTIWVLGRSSLGRRCWKGCLEFIGV